MDTFNFPYHTFSTQYPESSFRMQLGKGYIFTAAPDAPDQRIFKLTFPGMKYYTDGSGVADRSTQPTKNMAALEDFYKAHKQHATFIYPHPVDGNINVKFNKPLTVPKGIPGGNGLVEGFDIELLEVP